MSSSLADQPQTTAYLLTQASVQLLYGKLYSLFSIKWVFLYAVGVFELGSLVCGVAPTSIALICGRAIAGLGAAGISSGAIISTSTKGSFICTKKRFSTIPSNFVFRPRCSTAHLHWPHWCHVRHRRSLRPSPRRRFHG